MKIKNIKPKILVLGLSALLAIFSTNAFSCSVDTRLWFCYEGPVTVRANTWVFFRTGVETYANSQVPFVMQVDVIDIAVPNKSLLNKVISGNKSANYKIAAGRNERRLSALVYRHRGDGAGFGYFVTAP